MVWQPPHTSIKLTALVAVLVKLLEGDAPTLTVLRRQMDGMTVRSRDMTGVGFFVDFDHPPAAPRTQTRGVRFGDVLTTIDGLDPTPRCYPLGLPLRHVRFRLGLIRTRLR